MNYGVGKSYIWEIATFDDFTKRRIPRLRYEDYVVNMEKFIDKFKRYHSLTLYELAMAPHLFNFLLQSFFVQMVYLNDQSLLENSKGPQKGNLTTFANCINLVCGVLVMKFVRGRRILITYILCAGTLVLQTCLHFLRYLLEYDQFFSEQGTIRKDINFDDLNPMVLLINLASTSVTFSLHYQVTALGIIELEKGRQIRNPVNMTMLQMSALNFFLQFWTSSVYFRISSFVHSNYAYMIVFNYVCIGMVMVFGLSQLRAETKEAALFKLNLEEIRNK